MNQPPYLVRDHDGDLYIRYVEEREFINQGSTLFIRGLQ